MRDPRFRIIGLALFLGSCGGPDAGPDAAPAPDALRETALDAVADVLPDRGPAADTVDAVPDGAPETAADTLVIPPVPGAWCSPDGWCLERPTIPTLTIHAIGGVDSSPFFFQDKEDDVWFAGELGVMLHWDPSEPVGTGGTFQQVGPGRTLGDLLVLGADDAWAAGEGGACVHWDGTAWSTVPTGFEVDLMAVGGSPAAGTWVVGGEWIQEDEWTGHWETRALRWAGATFEEVPFPTTARITRLRADKDGTLYAAGTAYESGGCTEPSTPTLHLYRWDGETWAWAPVASLEGLEAADLWAGNPGEVFAAALYGQESLDDYEATSALLRLDGDALEEVATVETLRFQALDGPAADELRVVTDEAAFFRWTGEGLVPEPSEAGDDVRIETLRLVPGARMWAAGGMGRIFRSQGGAWEALQSTDLYGELLDLHGAAPDDLWAVGGLDSTWLPSESLLYHWDGTAWTRMLSGAPPGLSAVFARAADDVWAVGGDLEAGLSLILHFDGTAWTQIESPTDHWLRGVWAAAPDDAWAVGNRTTEVEGEVAGGILHWDGMAWTLAEDLGPAGLGAALSGTAADDVWATLWDAVEGHAVLLHWDGTAWGPAAVDVEGVWAVWQIWGPGEGSAFAAGVRQIDPQTAAGLLLHWDGTAWTELPAPAAGMFTSIWGTSDDDLWLAGDTGVFHWNGEAWTPTSLGVAIAPARIVGIGGTLRAVLGSMILARPLD